MPADPAATAAAEPEATNATEPEATNATEPDATTAAEPAVVDGVDVDALARAVRACVGVSDLYAGRFGEFGSYFPGRRIAGVRVDDDGVSVQVKARWGEPAKDLFAQILGVTAGLRHGLPLHLLVADVDEPDTTQPDTHVAAAIASGPALALPAPPASTPVSSAAPLPDPSPSAPVPGVVIPPESSSS